MSYGNEYSLSYNKSIFPNETIVNNKLRQNHAAEEVIRAEKNLRDLEVKREEAFIEIMQAKAELDKLKAQETKAEIDKLKAEIAERQQIEDKIQRETKIQSKEGMF